MGQTKGIVAYIGGVWGVNVNMTRMECVGFDSHVPNGLPPEPEETLRTKNIHSPKTNIDPDNGPMEDDFPPTRAFPVPIVDTRV